MTIALRAMDDRPQDEPIRGNAVSLRYEIAGRLNADSFRAMQEVEQEAAPQSVVEIDLRRCSGMDDFGFGSLVGLIRRLREQHAHVLVRGATDSVQESLRRSGVDRLVDLVPEFTTRDRRISDGALFL